MATTTSKLGLPRPEPSDNVTLANQQALIDAIDSNAASQSEVDAVESTANSAKQTAESHAERHATGGPDELTPEDIGAATQFALNDHVNATNNPHNVTSEQITQISEVPFTADYSSYPVGLSTMSVTADTGWPSRGVVITSHDSRYRLGQLYLEHQQDGQRFLWRDYHVTHGWTPLKEAETTTGAQTKASDAETRANGYTDQKIANVARTDGSNRFSGAQVIDDLLRLLSSSGVAFIQAGIDNTDENAELRIVRNGTSVGLLQFLRLYAELTTVRGDLDVDGKIRFGAGTAPYMDLQYVNDQYEFYPAGSGYGVPIMIGREMNRVDMPGGATIEGEAAWHNGNNPGNTGITGYQRLANGFIIQWGRITNASPNTDYRATFPIAFPGAIANIQTSVEVVSAIVDEGGSVGCVNRTTSYADLRHTFDANLTLYYVAIGY